MIFTIGIHHISIKEIKMEIMCRVNGQHAKHSKSNLSDFRSEDNKFIKELLETYRGLRLEDIEPMNPAYSCVICKEYKNCGHTGCACCEAKPATEEEFAMNYDFKI
jgi:hypothetical protein